MALNLSTLTSPANSSVLEEVNTTADFLESVPVFRNLSRSSNRGSDAKQDVALNQPRALPLIKNPSGNLGGYLYIPNVSNNYATGPSVTIGSNETWEGELDMVITQWGNYIMPMGGGAYNSGFGLLLYSDGAIRSYSKSIASSYSASGITLGTPLNIKYGYGAVGMYVKINDVIVSQTLNPNQSSSITHTLELAQNNNLTHQGNYAIQKAKLTVNSAVVFDCDFNGSTSIRHGDTKFQASVGGPVVLNQSGNDPATVIKKSVLRFDGVNDGLNGLFNQTITEGYMFAAFSVLGDGGDAYGRLFGASSTGVSDSQAGGFTFRRFDSSSSIQLGYNAGFNVTHSNVFNGVRGDLLLECKLTATSQPSKINNADADNGLSNLQNIVPNTLSSEEFRIATSNLAGYNGCFDLEFLALFPASITDDQADSVRNYINNRNNVFSLIDSQGYYFFDPQKASFTGNFTGANTLDGYITGSDLGDTDVRSNLTLEQSTLNDQPSTDGYTITFNDAAEHLEFENAASQTLAGWQVVGTSLGTFAYRVNNTAVTELNLLGNLGHASYRKAGDLYGIILLPSSATGREINEAKKLLTDRGASVSATADVQEAWRNRSDIVQFDGGDMSDVTNTYLAWYSCSSLESFSSSLPLVTNAYLAWYNCSSLSDFTTTDIKNCTNFGSAWQNCSALTSFPAGAKLGTEASSGVNFFSAWQQSGLESFPALDLSNGSNFTNAWFIAASMTEFSEGAKLGTNKTNVSFQNAFRTTGLTSFPALDLSSGNNFSGAWQDCSALTSFSAGAKLGTEANNVNFERAWRDSGLTSFPALDLSNAINLSLAWLNCTSMTTFGLIDTSGANSMYASWLNCNSLTSFPLIDTSNVTNFAQTWQECSSLTSFPSVDVSVGNNFAYTWYLCSGLTSFPANFFDTWNPSSISSGVFNFAWDDCSLTAQSVENILTSIDASNQHGTDDGTSTGNPLGDSGIDIDYNVATGSLSAATNTAIDSLSGKGWEVYINGVLVIPNILDLEPAAAYSLRSFDANADPNVVNVRRSSDGATSDFKASEVSDGTLVAFVGAGNDGHVTTWFDQSGNNNSSNQTLASSQPKIVDSGVLVTEGGLAALDFDGADDYLNTSQNNPFSFTGPVSMSCAYYKDATLYKNYETLLSAGSTGNGGTNSARSLALGFNNTAASPKPAYATDHWGPDGVQSTTTVSTNQRAIVTYNLSNFSTHRTAGNSEIRANGSALSVSAYNTDDPVGLNSNPMRIGVFDPILTGSFFSGTIQEIVVFNTDQATQASGIENNINDTYTIY